MKRKHRKTLERIFSHPVSANIKWQDIEALFNSLGAEFLELNGGADFYAKDIDNLKKEGGISLKIFLDACKKCNIEPKKEYSGKFNLRVPTNLHADIVNAAGAEGKSLNQWIVDALDHAAHI